VNEAIVRRAKIGDETAIAGLLIRLVEQHVEYDPKRFSNFVTLEGAARFYRGRIEAAEAAVLAAEIDNEVAGFAYLEHEPLNYAEIVRNAVWLHDIFLKPEARSAGTGNSLMQAAIRAAKELGGDKLLLSVAAKNEIAKGFFERFGFRQTMFEMTLDLTDGEVK
jgi:ribosomal protein S18 acetylase RimI-like enzyme